LRASTNDELDKIRMGRKAAGQSVAEYVDQVPERERLRVTAAQEASTVPPKSPEAYAQQQRGLTRKDSVGERYMKNRQSTSSTADVGASYRASMDEELEKIRMARRSNGQSVQDHAKIYGGNSTPQTQEDFLRELLRRRGEDNTLRENTRDSYMQIKISEDVYQKFLQDLKTIDIEEKRKIMKYWSEMQGTAPMTLKAGGTEREVSINREAAIEFLKTAGIVVPSESPRNATSVSVPFSAGGASESGGEELTVEQREWEIAINEALLGAALMELPEEESPEPLVPFPNRPMKARSPDPPENPHRSNSGEGRVLRMSLPFIRLLSNFGGVLERAFASCIGLDQLGPRLEDEKPPAPEVGTVVPVFESNLDEAHSAPRLSGDAGVSHNDISAVLFPPST